MKRIWTERWWAVWQNNHTVNFKVPENELAAGAEWAKMIVPGSISHLHFVV